MRWHAAHAHLPCGVRRDVLLEAEGGRFTRVAPDVPAASLPGAERLPGVVLPGLANAHSHAFQRALRGRTPADGGTFWTWRDAMFALAERLDPDTHLALARAVYAEMALGGITAVAEFHYLHHGAGGRPYADPNEMGHVLGEAASDAGIRLTLLDACYLTGGSEERRCATRSAARQRFSDGTVDAWAARVSLLRDHRSCGPAHVRVGVAAHSVRAVPRAALPVVREVARSLDHAPAHAHVSEQPAENEACLAVHGLTPTGLLSAEGLLDPDFTAVHATHVSRADVALLGGSGATACFCPTTERDLGDGIGPARLLLDAGASLSLGTDQHVVVDLVEEARALEGHERLGSGRRGRLAPEDLLRAATGHGSIGWPDAGRIVVGARADLVAVRDDTPRTAGALPEQILLVATAADVDTVVVDGRTVVCGGRHVLGDVGRMLQQAVAQIPADPR